MRLITHNLLCCNVKGCRANDVGLTLAVEQSQVVEREFNRENVLRVADALNWPLLAAMVHAVSSQSPARRVDVPRSSDR